MSLLRDLVIGRENGLRARLRRMLSPGGAAGATNDRGPSGQAPAAQDRRPVAAERALNLGVEAPKDVTPPDGYEVVLHKDGLKSGQVIEVIIAGKAIAVANVNGQYYALSNACPHAEGPLGEGALDGHTLTCPYHGWKFDIRDGGCLTSPGDKVRTYPVQIVRDAVCVAI
ncbi:Rieske 2Fe-2S domain-containing protein [Myxococcota bacterium]|nr:Rieske 2Fe-2S domain-containing protein [Myxococcota bacterium]